MKLAVVQDIGTASQNVKLRKFHRVGVVCCDHRRSGNATPRRRLPSAVPRRPVRSGCQKSSRRYHTSLSVDRPAGLGCVAEEPKKLLVSGTSGG